MTINNHPESDIYLIVICYSLSIVKMKSYVVGIQIWINRKHAGRKIDLTQGQAGR